MDGLRSPPGRFGCSACPVLSSCILSSLPKKNLAELEPDLRHFSLETGETIFHQGVPPAGLYILCEGYVKLVLRIPSGRRLLVRFCAPGDLLEGVVTEEHKVSAMAMDKAVVTLFPKELARGFLKRRPGLAVWRWPAG